MQSGQISTLEQDLRCALEPDYNLHDDNDNDYSGERPLAQQVQVSHARVEKDLQAVLQQQGLPRTIRSW